MGRTARGANSTEEIPDGDQESHEEAEGGQENLEHQNRHPEAWHYIVNRPAALLAE
jgi:hypothetical protein